MLLAVSSSFDKTRTLIDTARELSLTLSYFPDARGLRKLMGGESRRLVLLADDQLDEAIITCLERVDDQTKFGVIVCGDPEALRSSDQAEFVERFAKLDNIEWLSVTYDIDALIEASRNCRRRMLRLDKEALEQAIEQRQFILQYQPKVQKKSMTDWHTCEAEALIRWRHPQHGLLGPLEFLPEAEEFDLAGPIGEFVLNQAASQLCEWREQGLDLNSCINLAPSQLNDPGLPVRYEDLVRKHGLLCSNFTFEITEQDLANTEAPHLQVLHELRACGFRISLDDFRVAASSLGTFEELPFDEIKIHASALRRAQNNPVSQKVLAAVTALARNLGVSVCAEGIEDLATFDLLNSIQCDKMQGFLISESVMPDIMRRVYNVRSDRKIDAA